MVAVKNGFIEESELPVPQAREIVPVINLLLSFFPVMVASRNHWLPLSALDFIVCTSRMCIINAACRGVSPGTIADT